jgi:hypothetical protein
MAVHVAWLMEQNILEHEMALCDTTSVNATWKLVQLGPSRSSVGTYMFQLWKDCSYQYRLPSKVSFFHFRRWAK